MGAVRKNLLEKSHDPEAHRRIFETLIEQGLLDSIRNGQPAQTDRLLASVLGPEHGIGRMLAHGDDNG
jgi:hypothetical protein